MQLALASALSFACAPQPLPVEVTPAGPAPIRVPGSSSTIPPSQVVETARQDLGMTAGPDTTVEHPAVGSSKVSADSAAIQGRVEDARTGRGLANHTVILRLGNDHQQETRTDAKGRFSFVTESQHSRATIEVVAAPHWRRFSGPFTSSLRFRSSEMGIIQKLTQAERQGESEITVPMAETRTGTLHGLAVSSGLGEPLAGFRFTITPRKYNLVDPIEIVTDDRGRFELSDIQGGHHTIASKEAPPITKIHDCLPDNTKGNPWVLEFEVGPVLELELGGIPVMDGTQLTMLMFREGGAGPIVKVPVHSNSMRTWAHFRANDKWPKDGEKVGILVVDMQGLLAATTELPWNRSEPVAPLRLDLIRTSAIKLDLDLERRINGGPVFGQRASLTSNPRLNVNLTRVTQLGPCVADAFRRSSLKWLEPGRYQLDASTREHAPISLLLELVGGQIESIKDSLPFASSLRSVSGRLRAEDGLPLEDCRVTFSLQGPPPSTWNAVWERELFCGTGIDHFIHVDTEDGPETGYFKFPRVPQGPYVASASSSSSPLDIQTEEDEWGNVDIEILQLDSSRGPGFGFNIRCESHDTSESQCNPINELMSFGWIRVHTRVLDGGPALFPYAGSGEIISRDSPKSRQLEWAVVSNNHRPVFGTQADFLPAGNDCYFAEVALQSGWGTRILARGEENQPIEGARVWVDGDELGTTDANGVFDLECDSAPDQIELSYRDWTTANPRRITKRGIFRSPWRVVTLSPQH